VSEGNFAQSFSLQFLSIFERISCSIDPVIALIWVSLERSFLAAEVISVLTKGDYFRRATKADALYQWLRLAQAFLD